MQETEGERNQGLRVSVFPGTIAVPMMTRQRVFFLGGSQTRGEVEIEDVRKMDECYKMFLEKEISKTLKIRSCFFIHRQCGLVIFLH
ncbi:MAG: hypothetical protein KC553_00855 [Nitrospina sp.]|nr:hypothetical protein [Nitrospina sp.]